MGRKKADRTVLLARVATDTPAKIKEVAQAMGFLYDGEGSAGQLLDAIARGEIILIKGVDAQR